MLRFTLLNPLKNRIKKKKQSILNKPPEKNYGTFSQKFTQKKIKAQLFIPEDLIPEILDFMRESPQWEATLNSLKQTSRKNFVLVQSPTFFQSIDSKKRILDNLKNQLTCPPSPANKIYNGVTNQHRENESFISAGLYFLYFCLICWGLNRLLQKCNPEYLATLPKTYDDPCADLAIPEFIILLVGLMNLFIDRGTLAEYFKEKIDFDWTNLQYQTLSIYQHLTDPQELEVVQEQRIEIVSDEQIRLLTPERSESPRTFSI